MKGYNGIIALLPVAVAFLISSTVGESSVAANSKAAPPGNRLELKLLPCGPTAAGFPRYAPIEPGQKARPKRQETATSKPASTNRHALPAAHIYQRSQSVLERSAIVEQEKGRDAAKRQQTVPATPCEAPGALPPAPPVTAAAPVAQTQEKARPAFNWPDWLRAPYSLVTSLLSAPSR